MHEAVYCCLIAHGEAVYSAFISYRVASEAPLARILFDELNHSVTPGGHRVTVYWDAHRLVRGEDWEDGFATGLLNSLCFLPILSYGFSAPLATLPTESSARIIAQGWEEEPIGRHRLEGQETDWEDNVLKELLIAEALLAERFDACLDAPGNPRHGMLELAYPVLVGRQEPAGHPDYPRMGDYFLVHGGGGKFPESPSPPTARVVCRFLRDRAGLTAEAAERVVSRSVRAAMAEVTRLQGCQLWSHPKDLSEVNLTREQVGGGGDFCVGYVVHRLLNRFLKRETKISDDRDKYCQSSAFVVMCARERQIQLVGKGYAGPPVALGGVPLSDEQVTDINSDLEAVSLFCL